MTTTAPTDDQKVVTPRMLFDMANVGRTAEVEKVLEGRTARCSYASGVPDGEPHGKFKYAATSVPSSVSLAFFRYQPDEQHDRFYCGCWGWD